MNRMLRRILPVAFLLLSASFCSAAEVAEQESLVKGPSESLITAVTTLIIFVALVIVLGKSAWGPIVEGLKKREAKIRGDIADAEAARVRAEQTLAQYNAQLATAEGKVRDLIAQATADAEKVATNVRMKAQQESEEIKERAMREIEGARDAALREIYEKTADLATTVAEKIIRRNLNAADQQDLVNQSLEQLQSVR